MIKYLGSKRTLIPAIQEVTKIVSPDTAVDLFTGTTRVACAFKQLGIKTTANDIATYSKILADCYIATDLTKIDIKELSSVVHDLMKTPPKPGYFTKTFCEDSRFFQPKNGEKIDAIRNVIETEYKSSIYYPILLTSLMEAADRVDSTTGLQMAYLKQWSKRSYNELEMRIPVLLEGPGQATVGDAKLIAQELPKTDFMYLDPPYNQHRYFTNYHIWETLVRWDDPEAYGIARKRIDSRDDETKSVYNKKREMPEAFRELIGIVKAETLMISYNNESWISEEKMQEALLERYPKVTTLAFDYKRYVGAQIGIHNLDGRKVGKVSHLRNLEYLFVAGEDDTISRLNRYMKKFHIS